MGDLIAGFQQAVDKAWADPNHPESAMAIILFNEGTTLMAQKPVITLETRLNRFQGFLLFSSFLVHNAGVLDWAAEELLKARGIIISP